MELFEAIAKRHSYRGRFSPHPVPRETLQRIVQAGIQAPSGCNAQTTRFVIVDDPELISQIATWIPKPVVQTAPALIVCVVDHRPVYKEQAFGIEDCAAAVENMLLAITASGLASVWLDGVLRSDAIATRIGTLLGVPAELEVRVMLPVGTPEDPDVQRERLSFPERAGFNHPPVIGDQ